MSHRSRYFLLLFFLATIIVACSEKTDHSSSTTNHDLAPNDELKCAPAWKATDDGTLRVMSCEKKLIELAGVTVTQTGVHRAFMLFGFFRFRESETETTHNYFFKETGDAIVLSDASGATIPISIEKTVSGSLRLSIQPGLLQKSSMVQLRFKKEEQDAFWGFGEQYNFVDMNGQRFSVWTQEQGVGRSAHPILPTTGRLTDTYFPMPYFLDPGKKMGFLLENSEFSRFDLHDKAEWSVDVWDADRVSFVVFAGRPAEIVRKLTAETGRAKTAPPDWAFEGVWLGAQGGTDAVNERLQTALDAGIPVSAVWVQDWVGHREFGLGNHGVKYHWTLDETLYPDLQNTIADIREQGVRFLGYFNPFVVPAYDQFEEGAQNGWLIRRADGSVYEFPIITFFGTLLDATNPDAADWFQGFAREAVGLGMSGWMADFGEWLPYDAMLFSGEAPAVHNLYPTAWHRINREVLEDELGEDFVLLTRSGFTGEQRVAQVVWAGDQEADWTETDGLPTVVTAGLTLGLAGVPFFTHDIAGFSGGPSDKELFLRWTELGAFTPVMRTHDGLKKEENHRFDSDEETLRHFTKFARIHQALTPYFEALAKEAVDSGDPIVRHTALVDSDWRESLSAHRQWMLGDALLIAPVVKEGAAEVEVRLPEGEWTHLLTGEKHAGRRVLTVAAPIGTPAVFYKKGADLDEIAAAVRGIYEEYE